MIYLGYALHICGIFDTQHTGLSKLGASEAERSKAVCELLVLVGDIPPMVDKAMMYQALFVNI